MSVDIETEVVQLWAGSRVIADVLKSKLPTPGESLTISSTGLRSGHDNQLAGLSQILNLGSVIYARASDQGSISVFKSQ